MATNGATIQDLLPYLLPALQYAQQAAQQNYGLQMQRYSQADPLRQSLLAMSASLMPRYLQPQPFNLQSPLGMPSYGGQSPFQMPTPFQTGTAVPRQRIG